MRSRKRRDDPFEGRDTCVALFHSTNFALRAEKLVLEQGITVRPIPIPRHLSSDCGICLRLLVSDREGIIQILESNLVEYDRLEPFYT